MHRTGKDCRLEAVRCIRPPKAFGFPRQLAGKVTAIIA